MCVLQGFVCFCLLLLYDNKSLDNVPTHIHTHTYANANALMCTTIRISVALQEHSHTYTFKMQNKNFLKHAFESKISISI